MIVGETIDHAGGDYAVATKSKVKSAAAKARAAEAAAFLVALERHGQVQEAGAPLKPGVTHVKRTGPKGKVRLTRKRFSVI
jgi:hypothetical protein